MPATVIPTVGTERLTLRGHRLEDFEESFAMWRNPAERGTPWEQRLKPGSATW